MQATILILLVEDEPKIRSLLQEALEDGGYELVVARNGSEAVASLEGRADGLRGLITDIDLGQGPDGWDVARRARELKPEISIVYMSGASVHDWNAHGVPNSTMVAKPFAPAQILTAISALLNTTDSHH